jgi:hypothetical protein
MLTNLDEPFRNLLIGILVRLNQTDGRKKGLFG